MKTKNWIIGLLITTNILSLLIIFNKKTHWIDANKSNDKFTRPFYDVQALKETLIKDYNPTGEKCGAAISLSKRGSFSGTARLNITCLIEGTRKIAWNTLKDVKDELIDEYNTFAQLIKSEQIQELDGLSYRPEGKRNTLLFIKQKWIYEHDDFSANDFLQGYLLGYDENDIEFFYQRFEFREQQKEKNDTSVFVPTSYAEFSPELQKEFEIFKKYKWPTSKNYNRYEIDKKNAIDWINENKVFSDDQLYQQIQSLKKARF